VKLLVAMLEPFEGRVYDPCCGSGGMFVQSLRFVEAHGGNRWEVSVYGQESNATTWRLAKTNLAIRHIDANFGGKPADSFREDLHPDLRADYILANPPFNVSDWHGDQLRDDPRWHFGVPPENNANFAWVQHFYHHLSSTGTAGFVLAAKPVLVGSSLGEKALTTLVRPFEIFLKLAALNDMVFALVMTSTLLALTIAIVLRILQIIGLLPVLNDDAATYALLVLVSVIATYPGSRLTKAFIKYTGLKVAHQDSLIRLLQPRYIRLFVYGSMTIVYFIASLERFAAATYIQWPFWMQYKQAVVEALITLVALDTAVAVFRGTLSRE